MILDIVNINKIEGVGGLIMKIQRIHQDFSICQVEDYSLVNLESKYCFIEKQMKKSLWYALQAKYHQMLFVETMAGGHFAYKVFWNFL